MNALRRVFIIRRVLDNSQNSRYEQNSFNRAIAGLVAGVIFAAVNLIVIPILFMTSQAYGQSPTIRLAPVDWPDPQKGKSNLEALLTKKHKPGIHIVAAELATVKLPVLVPEQLFDFDNLTVGAIGENQYYANANSAGFVVTVNGSRIVHDIPAQSPAKNSFAALNPHEYRVTHVETGYRLSLKSYGVPYLISTECRPADRRCTEQYIRSLADRMTYIGGEP